MLHWDGSNVLPKIDVPTLIISGNEDVTTLPVASDRGTSHPFVEPRFDQRGRSSRSCRAVSAIRGGDLSVRRHSVRCLRTAGGRSRQVS